MGLSEARRRLGQVELLAHRRHQDQFRDEGDGLRARLTVEFPWLVGPVAVAATAGTLACEFSTWIEAATADGG